MNNKILISFVLVLIIILIYYGQSITNEQKKQYEDQERIRKEQIVQDCMNSAMNNFLNNLKEYCEYDYRGHCIIEPELRASLEYIRDTEATFCKRTNGIE